MRGMAQSPLDHTALFNARLVKRSVQTETTPPAHQQWLSDWSAAIVYQLFALTSDEIRLMEASAS